MASLLKGRSARKPVQGPWNRFQMRKTLDAEARIRRGGIAAISRSTFRAGGRTGSSIARRIDPVGVARSPWLVAGG
jgi:hypothetical protein